MTVAFEYLPFCSIVAYAHHEAWTHMFCRNVSAKTDLGTMTYREWFENYWTVFYHYRWIQKRKANHYLDCELQIMVAAVITKRVSAGRQGGPYRVRDNC